MKKTLFIFMIAAGNCFFSSAQNFIYTKLNAPYVPLTGTTEMYPGEIWEDPSFFDVLNYPENQIDLTFDYQYGNFSLDSVTIFEEGSLMFIDSVGSSFFFQGDGFSAMVTPNLLLSPTKLDITDREISGAGNVSKIAYKVEGSAGSKIFKMEYDKVGLYDEDSDSSTTNDYFSFQVWIYEGSNVIEYRYGPNSVTNTEYITNNNVGIYKSGFFADTIFSGISIEGSYNNEDSVYLHDINLTDYYYTNPTYSGLPADGTVYRFAPGNLGLNKNTLQSNFVIFPNPTNQNSNLKISSKELFDNFEICNLTGQVITSGKLENNTVQISNITQGNYFITLKNEHVIATEKLTVR